MHGSTLTIFYDGLCHLCSREIEHYRKRVTTQSVEFVDITDPTFDAQAHGLNPEKVHKEMHVKLDNQVHIGVNAFLAIWQVIPGYRWLRSIVRFPGIYSLCRVGYFVFAKIRPWLPRRKRKDCETGVCER